MSEEANKCSDCLVPHQCPHRDSIENLEMQLWILSQLLEGMAIKMRAMSVSAMRYSKGNHSPTTADYKRVSDSIKKIEREIAEKPNVAP